MTSEGQSPTTGKWRFILLHGVLGWGVPFFLLMLAWDYFEQGGFPPGMKIASLGCVSAFGGFILGNWIWKDRAKKT